MTTTPRWRRRFAATLVAVAAAAPAGADPEAVEALDEETRAAIKTACHGWIYEDAANWIAGWLGGVSPVCDAEEQARLRALGQAPAPEPRPRPYLGPGYVPTDFGGGDPHAALRLECDHDYMCVRTRVRAVEAGLPVDMAEYRHVSERCAGEYGCIEKVFEDLSNLQMPPAREAPPPTPGAQPTGGGEPAPTPAPVVATGADATATGAATPAPAQGRPPPRLLEASIRLDGRDPATVEVAVMYRNLAPIHMFVGPVELEMRCRDGTDGRAAAGGARWLAPGETAAARLTGEQALFGQSCPAGIESYRPTGLVRQLQAGLTGYDEQVAVCPDGRREPVVLAMSDAAGRRYAFHTGDGRSIEVDIGAYDAREILGRICGTGRLDGPQAAFVAGEAAYLSRDFFNLMDAWSRACANVPDSCARDYAAWAATRPR